MVSSMFLNMNESLLALTAFIVLVLALILGKKYSERGRFKEGVEKILEKFRCCS